MRTFTQLPTPQSLLCSFSYKGREGRGQTDQCHKPNFSQSKKKKKMEEPAATFLVPTPPPPPLQELLQDILLRSISESQVTPSEVFNNNKKKKKKKQNIYFHPQPSPPPTPLIENGERVQLLLKGKVHQLGGKGHQHGGIRSERPASCQSESTARRRSLYAKARAQSFHLTPPPPPSFSRPCRMCVYRPID